MLKYGEKQKTNNNMQSKPKQKTFSTLKKKHFELHFNPDHTNLKM